MTDPELPPLRVFISYSRRDAAKMRAVRQLLRAPAPDQIAVFVDADTLVVGDPWNAKLIRALEQCDVFVLLWSWNARTSRWVEREWGAALARSPQPRIVPVLLDNVELPPALCAFQTLVLPPDVTPIPLLYRRLRAGLLALSGILAMVAVAWSFQVGNARGLRIVTIVTIWTFVLAFVALRARNAPWKRAGYSDDVPVLFGTLTLTGPEAEALLVLSAVLGVLSGCLSGAI